MILPSLDICLEKTIIWKDTCTSVFSAAPFMTAMTWKRSKCPSTEEMIKMEYMYTMKYQLALKENGIVPFTAT